MVSITIDRENAELLEEWAYANPEFIVDTALNGSNFFTKFDLYYKHSDELTMHMKCYSDLNGRVTFNHISFNNISKHFYVMVNNGKRSPQYLYLLHFCSKDNYIAEKAAASAYIYLNAYMYYGEMTEKAINMLDKERIISKRKKLNLTVINDNGIPIVDILK